jgi:hypothetical protein
VSAATKLTSARVKGNVAILADITGTHPAERQYRELAAKEEKARTEIRAERCFRQLPEAARTSSWKWTNRDASCW